MREEAQRAREAAEAEAQKPRDAKKALQDAQFAEAEKARELRLAELKEARELRELELKAEKENSLLEAEKEAAAHEHELKMASLGEPPLSDKASVFDPARNIRLVLPFQEKEVDKYFAHFEKVADSLNWPKESWVLLLQSVLVGKAQEIYGSLSVEQSSNYEHVKEAILKAYELVPEAYRQKFRNYLKYDSKTHVEFEREKENLFNRWCHSKEIGQDFKNLKQMVLLEEFKDKVRPDIRSHLDEQKVEELEKAAVMADDYALTHKMSSKSGNTQQKRYHGSGNIENTSRNMDDRKRQVKSTENVGLVSKVEPLKPISCGHCGKPGHIITNWWKLGGKTLCEHCGRFNHKSPRVVEKPRDDEKTERLAEKFPGIFPASVVTRSMKAKKEAIKEQGKEEIGLSGTFLENTDVKFEERNSEKAEKDLMKNESRNNIPEKQESESRSVISRQNLIEDQSNDKELLDWFKIALTPVEAEKVSVGYLVKDNILMRKWSPTECDNSEKGATVYQIVVPTVHRREVLELAHDLPMSGHLGVRKTHNRILQHFFWPGLKRDVAKWCKECHTCQLGGKPNQKIPQAPLHPIPAFDEPFSHIIIDCVGPLPKTKSQNEYLLTIMCSSTRFPEAIPLRSIETNTLL